MKTVTPSEAKKFVIKALKCNEIPYLAGPPGIGKSDIVAQISKEFNLKLIDIRLSQMLPEDLMGLPKIEENGRKAKYIPFSTFPLEDDIVPLNEDGWLVFLDELSSASQEVMAAIYNLLLGRKVGGYKLHPKALIVAAGNRSTDSAIVNKLPDTLLTRMLPITVIADVDSWVTWAKENGVNEHVIEFIRKYDDMFYSRPEDDQEIENTIYPTPRGWGKVSKIMNYHEKNSKKVVRKDKEGIPTGKFKSIVELEKEDICLISSAIGNIAANSFKEFYNNLIKIPFPWEVVQAPATTIIPINNIHKSDVIKDLCNYSIENSDVDTRDKILIYINRFDREYRELYISNVVAKLEYYKYDKNKIKLKTERLKNRLNCN